MFRSYGELFQVPGTRAFSLTGFFGRIPISMLSIGSVLLIQQTTGKYALAGIIVACATLAGAVVMPQIARLIDRRGQRRVTRPVILVGASGLVLTIVAVTFDWPVWTWFVFAMIGGGSEPSVGAMVRARWTHSVPDAKLRQRAFSWESSIDEVVFILGPPLATLLAIQVAPYAGLLAAAVILVVGGWVFTAQRSTEPPPTPFGDRVPRRALLKTPLLLVAGVLACTGAAFGAIEITVVAYTAEEGRPGLAGLVLAAYAGGSLVAGLTFGVLRFRRSIGGQFVVAAALFGILTPLLLLTPNLVVLVLLNLICGLSVAPVLISSTLVIERIVAPSALTEALTWSVTCIIVGVTAGTAGAGLLIDAYGAHWAFVLPATAAVLSALVAVLGRRHFTAAAVSASAGTAYSEVDCSAPALTRAIGD